MAKKWQSLDECQANGRVLTKDKWHCFGELHANGKMQKANLSAVKAACLMGSGLRSGVSQLEERRLRSSGSGAPGGALIFIQTSNDDILQKFMLNKIKTYFLCWSRKYQAPCRVRWAGCVMAQCHAHPLVRCHAHPLLSCHAHPLISCHAHPLVSCHAHPLVRCHAHPLMALLLEPVILPPQGNQLAPEMVRIMF